MHKYISFTIPVKGFIQRPDKNPVGYTRTTQRGAKFDPKARLYEAWKDYVWSCCNDAIIDSGCDELPEKNQKVRLDMMIYYKNNSKSDASNIFKGIEDALAHKKMKLGRKMIVQTERVYENDNYCIGSFDFDYDKENPRVEVKISW